MRERNTARFCSCLTVLLLCLLAGLAAPSAWAADSGDGESSSAKATLSETSMTLEVGMIQRLTVDNRPKGVKVNEWTTSNSEVARVTSGGNVKANKPGTAKIKAYLSNNKTLTCVVTVPKVEISEKELTLVKGKTKTLKVSGSKAEVTWSSSKPDVASVSGKGKVKALSYGSSTVTAKIGNAKLTCKIKVSDPTLSESSLCLLTGDSYTLTGSRYYGAAQWASSDTSVATVTQGGVVTAKKEGKAKITLKADGVTGSCSLTVATAELDTKEKEMVSGDSCKISVTGSAQDGSWSSSDTSKMTVSSDGTCTAKGTGEVTVTYTVGKSTRSCDFLISKKSASKNFASNISQTSVGISSLRNTALGSSSRYRFLQGSCTDGTYGYFLLGDQSYRPQCALIKIRLSDWKIVKTRTGLQLYHGNDMTIKNNTLMVVNGEGNKKTITYVSARTLKIKKNVSVKEEAYSLAYNQKKNRYVMGISGTDTLAIKDSSWKTLKTFDILKSDGYTRQGIDCDDSHIYVVQSYLSKGKTRILIYDWKGNYITKIQIPSYLEAESMFHVGNRYIISYNDGSYKGGSIYTTSLRHYYLVQYKASGGKGTQSWKMVKNGSGFTAASCKFTRKGYKFVGWTATRSSDGKSAYRNTKTKKVHWYKAGEQPKKYELYVIPAKKRLSSMSSTAGDCITLSAVWEKEEEEEKEKK